MDVQSLACKVAGCTTETIKVGYVTNEKDKQEVKHKLLEDILNSGLERNLVTSGARVHEKL